MSRRVSCYNNRECSASGIVGQRTEFPEQGYNRELAVTETGCSPAQYPTAAPFERGSSMPS